MLWLSVLLSLALLWGCTKEEPPPPVPPAPEDLSTWTVPELVQPPPPAAPVTPGGNDKPTAAEKVYEFASGGTYKALVAVGTPLDLLFERGEEIRNYVGGDPEPLAEGQQANRWEVKPGISGKDVTVLHHLFVRATEPGLKMGLIVTTTKRIYYLACESVKASPIRAIRWTYAPDPLVVAPPKEPGLLPDPQEPRQYHVGYTMDTSKPVPHWQPRQILDDGRKTYILYPEIALFETVPMVRLIGPNGPQLVNARQYLNVVILDMLLPRAELRVGIGDHAETITILRSQLRTIACPGAEDCPVWPQAAQALARKGGQP